MCVRASAMLRLGSTVYVSKDFHSCLHSNIIRLFIVIVLRVAVRFEVNCILVIVSCQTTFMWSEKRLMLCNSYFRASKYTQ